MRVISALLCLPLCSGCSFLFTQRPPDNHEQLVYFDCTSSGAAPASDVLSTVLYGLTAVSAARDYDTTTQRVGVGFGVVAAVTAASAIYGFVSNGSCSDAKAALEQRLVRMQVEHAGYAAAAGEASKPSGCSRDLDCKGDRVCVERMCVEPAAPSPQASPPAPPPAVPPPPVLPPPVSPPAESSPAGPSAPVPSQSFPLERSTPEPKQSAPH